jgi:hypothetical protein
LRALRDGLLLLQLQPGMGIAAPDHYLLQYQPALLLATLLQGAAYLHLSAQDIVRGGPALEDLPLRVLILHPLARDIMLERKARSLSSLELFLLSVREQPTAQPYRDWTRRFGAEGIAAAAFAYDAAVGGSYLFSLRRAGAPPELLQPAPGLDFELEQPDESGEPARAGYGVFEPLPESPGVLLSRRDNAYVYAGPVEPTRGGRPYPAREVESIVAELPFVIGASVYLPSGDTDNATLLIFTGPEPDELAQKLEAPREAALRERIRVQLGPEYVPTTVEQLAMFPRLRDGAFDHAWCRRMYEQSQLRPREAHPLFRLLDRLRAACTRPLWTDTSALGKPAGGAP